MSMHQAFAPAVIRMFGNLSAILDKAVAYAESKKIDPAVLVNARLAPDMFPLARQIQIATDVVKGGAARLAGIDVPSFPDTETTFPDLQARIKKCVAFVESIKPAQIDGTENKEISLKVGGRDLTFKGQDYLSHFVMPNFYFHVTTTYAILRHNGMAIGKGDYLGSV
jgi:hypothetical protein